MPPRHLPRIGAISAAQRARERQSRAFASPATSRSRASSPAWLNGDGEHLGDLDRIMHPLERSRGIGSGSIHATEAPLARGRGDAGGMMDDRDHRP